MTNPNPARVHPSESKFAKELTTPIELVDPLVVALMAHGRGQQASDAFFAEVQQYVLDERFRKLQMLLEHYGLKLNGPDEKWVWMKLSFLIACDYVSGFSAPVIKQAKKPRGRPKGTGKIDRQELLTEVFSICNQRGCGVSQACHLLSGRRGPWKGINPLSLETRYYEAVEERRKWIAELEEFKKNPPPLLRRLEELKAKFPRVS